MAASQYYTLAAPDCERTAGSTLKPRDIRRSLPLCALRTDLDVLREGLVAQRDVLLVADHVVSVERHFRTLLIMDRLPILRQACGRLPSGPATEAVQVRGDSREGPCGSQAVGEAGQASAPAWGQYKEQRGRALRAPPSEFRF